MPSPRSGVVSVVFVNFRGAEDIVAAVRGLDEQHWPADRREVIVVDNASGDGSLDTLRVELPAATVVDAGANLGFAGGSNLGVRHSTGEYLAFLNGDARAELGWIRAAVSAFESRTDIGAVASRVMDEAGDTVDFVDAALTWYAQALKPYSGEPLPRVALQPRDVLFGTGAALFVRRADFDAVGGFDDRYFMFFEDVDLGWRLNLRGRRVAYVPESVVRHRHHASMTGFAPAQEQYLLERNALFTLYKNASDETLRDALPATMALAIRRGLSAADEDTAALDLRRGPLPSDRRSVSVDALAPLYAIDAWTDALPDLARAREQVQVSRTVSDAELTPLFGERDAPVRRDRGYLDGYSALTEAFAVVDGPGSTRVLVLTGDPIGPRLAGPAIRAWNLAAQIALHHEVTLAALGGVQPGTTAPFRLVALRAGDEAGYAALERESDVVLFQGNAMALFDGLRDSEKVLVADLYDPMHLEQLEQARSFGGATWSLAVSDASDVVRQQLERADFVLAASERQRWLYLGHLLALGRIGTAEYARDSSLRGLVDVVSFGLPDEEPVHTRAALRGVLDPIAEGDRVVIWAGGVYDWFDPETLVLAIARLAERRPDVRLVFLGTRHPNPEVPESAAVARTRALARELGVEGVHVLFNDTWVEYAERADYLLEADAGVSTHFAHLETTFSFRTRILDYLWAGLPMVVTEGDVFADLVAAERLGEVVPPEDPDRLAEALERILYDTAYAAAVRERTARVRERYRWSRVVRPLVRFLSDPARARDLALGGEAGPRRVRSRRPKRRGIRHDLRMTVRYLRAGGPLVVARKIARRLGRR